MSAEASVTILKVSRGQAHLDISLRVSLSDQKPAQNLPPVDPRTTCPFGKSRGVEWKKVPKENLCWYYNYYSDRRKNKNYEKYWAEYNMALEGINEAMEALKKSEGSNV